ncbi:MAG: alpha/beta hydrolase [Gammaproteobacteria bacterium]|nr:alpha/beta hydrolase [Gammaproteobacteria bacterium]MBU2426396.1 alpha/beta hydrolase [Gammaproteobacteria bacterium]
MKLLHRTFRRRLLAFALVSAAASHTVYATEQITTNVELPRVEQTTATFLNALAQGGGTPLEQLSPEDARAVLTGAQAGAKLPAAEVSEKWINLNGEKLKLVIVRPAGSKGTLPAFMFFHGGGWVLGDFPTHERLIRDLVSRSGAVAVYVDYTPSPEAKYPTAINQAYAATQWVAAHGAEINVDGQRLAVAGNSVGGNMAAVVALKAKAAGTPNLKFQLLLWPVTDANFDNASYQHFQQGYFLSRNMMRWFWDSYTTNPAERSDIYASPLRASVEQLKGLPPALVQTAELDVLRDEGEAYAVKLNQAGVKVTSVRYNGMIHDFGLLNVLSEVPAVKMQLDQAGQALKVHLQ